VKQLDRVIEEIIGLMLKPKGEEIIKENLSRRNPATASGKQQQQQQRRGASG
jgi:hypothetical protein